MMASVLHKEYLQGGLDIMKADYRVLAAIKEKRCVDDGFLHNHMFPRLMTYCEFARKPSLGAADYRTLLARNAHGRVSDGGSAGRTPMEANRNMSRSVYRRPAATWLRGRLHVHEQDCFHFGGSLVSAVFLA